MAIPTWQANGTPVESTGDATVVPPTHLADDVLVLFASTNNEAVAAPTDWTEFPNSPQGTGTAGAQGSCRLSVFWRRATSGSTTSPVIADPGNHVYAVIAAFRGCRVSGDPHDVTAGDTEADSTTLETPTVTTTVADTLIIAACAHTLDGGGGGGRLSGWTNSNLTDVTERFDNGTNLANDGGIAFATGGKAAAGATGATTATFTGVPAGRLTIALVGAASAVEGSANITTGAVTSGAAGTLTDNAAAAVTLGAVTSSAAGEQVNAGALSATLGAVTSSAEATQTLGGQAAVTLGAVTSTAAGSLTSEAAASATLGAATLAAEATLGDPPLTATASIALGAATASATATLTTPAYTPRPRLSFRARSWASKASSYYSRLLRGW